MCTRHRTNEPINEREDDKCSAGNRSGSGQRMMEGCLQGVVLQAGLRSTALSKERAQLTERSRAALQAEGPGQKWGVGGEGQLGVLFKEGQVRVEHSPRPSLPLLTPHLPAPATWCFRVTDSLCSVPPQRLCTCCPTCWEIRSSLLIYLVSASPSVLSSASSRSHS